MQQFKALAISDLIQLLAVIAMANKTLEPLNLHGPPQRYTI